MKTWTAPIILSCGIVHNHLVSLMLPSRFVLHQWRPWTAKLFNIPSLGLLKRSFSVSFTHWFSLPMDRLSVNHNFHSRETAGILAFFKITCWKADIFCFNIFDWNEQCWCSQIRMFVLLKSVGVLFEVNSKWASGAAGSWLATRFGMKLQWPRGSSGWDKGFWPVMKHEK